MQKYKSLHLWMIIPLAVMQLGIFMDYWGDFTENAWSVHIHYWTGTVWYIYLIIQPYYATHGQLARHRTNGIIGMFLAGGVCFTAFSMMYRDIENVNMAMAEPERFGPFTADFFYGVAACEIPMIIIFGYAVIMSILKRKQIEDHAWWLVSTVFIIMMPALGRGVQNIFLLSQIDKWPNIDIVFPTLLSQVIILLLIIGAAWKYEKLTHPATFWALAINIYCLFIFQIGETVWVQRILNMLIKG